MHWLPADKLRYQERTELIGDVIVPDINAVEIANMRQCVWEAGCSYTDMVRKEQACRLHTSGKVSNQIRS